MSHDKTAVRVKIFAPNLVSLNDFLLSSPDMDGIEVSLVLVYFCDKEISGEEKADAVKKINHKIFARARGVSWKKATVIKKLITLTNLSISEEEKKSSMMLFVLGSGDILDGALINADSIIRNCKHLSVF